MDIETLSRIQFGFTAGFHIIFPTLLIGLSTFLSFLYWRWLRTNDQVFLDTYTLWLNILAVVYVVAAISGIALSAQLDNVFGGFYEKAQTALIPVREVELMFAILLEGGCIGVMLLHRRKERSYGRFTATLLFNFGIFLTAFFVISRNSWMNTPTGVEWLQGEAVVLSHWAVIFNPSFPLRYFHMLIAGLMASAFLVMGLSACRYLKNGSDAVTKKSMVLGLSAAFFFTIAQFIIGHFHGHDVLTNQPVKFAAMEGQWETERGASFKVFAIPDSRNEENLYSVEIPKALSLLMTFDTNGEIKGLKEVAPEERPNVAIVFYSFRIMIVMALLMLITVVIGMRLMYQNKLESSRWFLKLAVIMVPSGLIAVISGWVVAEVGRQPWTVYGVIKTADIITAQSSDQLLMSMTIFGLSYLLMGIITIVLFRYILFGGGRVYENIYAKIS
ncbi:MAG: cytochrome ubiquinol oxidase subunit I [Gammaproteobacteria bacterium]|nr:cytochrome ubiquinol oxidase subunit I [Gammaproteobacteria bacterium]